MPVFHDLNLLFVHIPKNAGRSIEAALLGNTGSPDDGRRNIVGGTAAALQKISRSAFAERYLIGTIDRAFAAQHLTYAEMQMLGVFEEESAKAWRRFCVVRNPFDRAISSVMHSVLIDPAAPDDPASFEKALEHWLDRPLADHNQRAHRRPQFDFVIDNYGKTAVDKILRFETLGDDFAQLAAELDLTHLQLGWRGKSTRLQTYRDYFTSHARKLIEREFAVDLEAFGYAF